MKIINSPQKIQEIAGLWRADNLQIGLVPTMGNLHEGHLSLIRAAVEDCDITVLSIFVNPAQFGPSEDYAAYPRSLARDIRLAYEAGADCIFAPSPKDMYPKDFSCYVVPENLSHKLCGKSRPGHFKGVCTVVLKLFNLIRPHYAYFGQKDAQQYIILRQMVKDFNLNLKLCRLPIIREEDGLAKSSRNAYLSSEERREAAIIYRALKEGQRLYEAGENSALKLKKQMADIIKEAPGANIDYIEIVDANTLNSLNTLKKPFMLGAAVYFGKTRLIDNIILD